MAAAVPRRRRRAARLSGGDRVAVALMVGVPLFVVVGLVWVPTILSGVLSFTSWDGIGGVSTIEWVGTRNYKQIFEIYPPFWPAFRHNVIWLVFLTLVPTMLGLLFAYLLDKRIRGTRVYQSIFFLPVVLSLAVVGFIWKAVMFSRDQGLLNKVWPGGPIDFVGDQTKIFDFDVPLLDFPLGLSRNFAALLLAMAWRHIGYIMVLYLAGLKSVDPALREAAAIDGCNEWQSFRSVVFPALKPINVVVAVITVIEALRAYDIVAALNEPRGTEVMGTLVTSSLLGEGGGRVGIGSAYGVVLLFLCLGFIIWYVYNNFREAES
jgi:multiple sugar transport system permease protein